MSDYESHTGKIKYAKPLPGETFEKQCERLWHENSGNGTYYEGALFDDFYEKYLKVKGQLWEVFDHEELGDDDDMFCNLHDNHDGTYSFHTRFYNGGTCLSEMLEDAVDELDVQEDLDNEYNEDELVKYFVYREWDPYMDKFDYWLSRNKEEGNEIINTIYCVSSEGKLSQDDDIKIGDIVSDVAGNIIKIIKIEE